MGVTAASSRHGGGVGVDCIASSADSRLGSVTCHVSRVTCHLPCTRHVNGMSVVQQYLMVST